MSYPSNALSLNDLKINHPILYEFIINLYSITEDALDIYKENGRERNRALNEILSALSSHAVLSLYSVNSKVSKLEIIEAFYKNMKKVCADMEALEAKEAPSTEKEFH